LLFSFFLDSCFFASQVPQIEDACPPDNASLVYIDLFDEGGGDGENPFHSYIPGDLPHREGFGGSFACPLENDALEVLDAFLVPFLDLIMNRYGVSGFESRKIPFRVIEFLNKIDGFRAIHDSQSFNRDS